MRVQTPLDQIQRQSPQHRVKVQESELPSPSHNPQPSRVRDQETDPGGNAKLAPRTRAETRLRNQESQRVKMVFRGELAP